MLHPTLNPCVWIGKDEVRMSGPTKQVVRLLWGYWRVEAVTRYPLMIFPGRNFHLTIRPWESPARVPFGFCA